MTKIDWQTYAASLEIELAKMKRYATIFKKRADEAQIKLNRLTKKAFKV
jgi:hypothetical protein